MADFLSSIALNRRLEELYEYDPDTGHFTRLKKTDRLNDVGDIAGKNTPDDQYINITINGTVHTAHRLAFLYMTGLWPKNEVDHINRRKNDNRWCNLRQCNRYQNARNVAPKTDSVSGYKGVSYYSKTKWKAGYTKDGEYIDIGLFDCKHKAARAYNDKVTELSDEFAYLNEIKNECI